jgi:tetratricopeptide (TPR) repeat protein
VSPDQTNAAVAELRQIDPPDAETANTVANALADLGDLDGAISRYERALQLRPDWPDALNNLGTVLLKRGDADRAAECHRRALAVDPQDARAHCYLGDALASLQQFDAAADCYRKSLAIDPGNAEAHNNLGNVWLDLGRVDEAVAAYRRATSLLPDSPAVHANLSQALLTHGDLLEGFAEQESRWRLVAGVAPGTVVPGIWTGDDPAGRTILVHAEQGFGDTIHFARYVPLLARGRGARVIVECQPALHRLLQSLDGVHAVVVRGQPLPPFDAGTMLLSLPAIFGTTLESIPNRVPYLSAPADVAARWRERLAHDRAGLKVGLAWAGNPKQANDHNRSMPFAGLARGLAGVFGVSFYSLQRGDAAAAQVRRDHLPHGMTWTDPSADLHDFAETAGLIAQLDLVIAVDTSVAHLAGALGKPVWTLLTLAPDWRWLLARDDSPWYPTMRLFRQRARGDWVDVVARVASSLREQVER